MFKITRNNLAYLASFAAVLIGLSNASLLLKNPVLNIIRRPSIILLHVQRELNGIIFYHRNLVDIQRLKRDADLLRQKINNMNEAYLENARLKDLLDLKNSPELKVIAARVIGRSADSWSASIIIDKGLHQGIRRNMVVVNFLGLVGRIVEAGEFTSKVMLITDSNMSVAALVQRSRQEGIVSGALGPNLTMHYLPEGSDVAVNDIIVTSALSSIYPKGIIIGKVTEVGNEFSGLSRYAIVKPAVAVSSIEEVLVVVP